MIWYETMFTKLYLYDHYSTIWRTTADQIREYGVNFSVLRARSNCTRDFRQYSIVPIIDVSDVWFYMFLCCWLYRPSVCLLFCSESDINSSPLWNDSRKSESLWQNRKTLVRQYDCMRAMWALHAELNYMEDFGWQSKVVLERVV